MTHGARWRVAAASTIGTSHDATGAPCQDAHACEFLATGEGGTATLFAVADGAGTASRSDVGAATACRELARLVREHLDAGGSVAGVERTQAVGWIVSIVRALSALADGEGVPVREYACTLLAVVADESHAAFLQIGDGAIVVSEGPEDGWSWVFWPQHGEFANTTNFVVAPDAADVLEFKVDERRFVEVALFTDGIENLVLRQAERSVHQPFFSTMIKPVRESPVDGVDAALSDGLARYLAAPVVTDRTDDDKTLILASRMARPASFEAEPAV
ncbi:MAG: protein phosphatase 2C domain-containing protein [Rhodospirillales bacterium]|nr:MAG: protein phosphatase 2C domain-containing protein [Rhodospirillales bacterium]